jgi:hypothetical protein
MTSCRRGLDHSIFTASPNYYGDGKIGTLENALEFNDESTIPIIVDLSAKRPR